MKKITIQTWLLLMAALLLIASVLVLSLLTLEAFKREINPAMDRKAEAVADSLEAAITHVTNLGVPLDQLRGVVDVFTSYQEENPEVIYLAIQTSDGQVLHELWQFDNQEQNREIARSDDIQQSQRELNLHGETIGTLIIGIDKHFMQRQMNQILLDIITVLVVSILVAIELLIFLTVYVINTPLQTIRMVMLKVQNGNFTHSVAHAGGDEVGRLSTAINGVILRLNHLYQKLRPGAFINGLQFTHPNNIQSHFTERVMYIRPPLFLLIFSESMSLAFFPMYVESLYEPVAGISREVIIGLPISIFMLVWALSLPFAGQWSDRAGRRRTFMVGAVLTAVGLVLTGMAQDVLQLLIWRSVTAVGYGIVFITAQSYVIDHTDPENRTKGMAIFLSAFFSGSLCGVAIGAILADRVGFELTFYLSALFSLLSALFVARFMIEYHQPGSQSKSTADRLSWQSVFTILSDRYFLAVTFLSAIPAKMALTGFLYYASPLYLMHLGATQSAAGRVMMAYGLAIIILSPLMAWAADRLRQRQSFIVIGGILSGMALLGVHFMDNLWGMMLGVSLLGIAHAIGISPQLAVITEGQKRRGMSGPVGKTVGIFRLTERIGNISGPLIAAILIALFGFSGAFLGMGIAILFSAILFALLMFMFSKLDRRSLHNTETKS